MKLIKGREIANKILQEVKKGIEKNKSAPGLAVILIGNDEASKIYVGLKEKAAKKVGVKFFQAKFDADVEEGDVLQKIKEFNADEKINGIIVQLPLLDKFNTQKIIDSIDSRKDVDGFCPANVEKFLQGGGDISPVFPGAIISLIESVDMDVKKKIAVVISNSDEFGEVMIAALKRKNIGGEYILSGEVNGNLDKIKKADILISACGIPGLLRGEMFKRGVVVIDGGVSKINGKVIGDVNFREARGDIAISPVPGGVGPVTVATLIKNVYLLSKK